MMSPRLARFCAAIVLAAFGVAPVAAQVSDSNSSLLQLLLMGSGLHSNDWGTQTNTNLQKIENAIAATTSKSLTGGSVTLTDDEARPAVLTFTGTLGSNAVVTVPSRSKAWTIINATAGAYTLQITTAAGSPVTIAQNALAARLYYCNGSAIFDVTAGGIPSLTANTIMADLGSGTVAATYAQIATALGLDAASSPSFANLQLKAAAGTYRTISFQTVAAARWNLFTDNAAEAGANAGSDLGLVAYADDGVTTIGTALKITRKNMAADFAGPVSAPSVTAGGVAISAPGEGLYRAQSIVVASDSTITAKADVLTMTDGSGNVKTFRGLNETASTACNGAVNCFDTGGPGTNRWIYVWAIGKSDGTVKTLLTINTAGSPALPSPPSPLPTGYAYYVKLGAVRIDGSARVVKSVQWGRSAQWVVQGGSTSTPSMPRLTSGAGSSGSVTVPTWTSVSIADYAPPSASVFRGMVYGIAGATIMVAPNDKYGAYNSTTNPPPMVISNTAIRIPFAFLIEDMTIKYAADSSGMFIFATGWDDNL